MKRNEASLTDLWDIKCTNIFIYRGSQEEKRKKVPEKIFEEIIAENFPDMGKEPINQVQKHKQFQAV